MTFWQMPGPTPFLHLLDLKNPLRSTLLRLFPCGGLGTREEGWSHPESVSSHPSVRTASNVKPLQFDHDSAHSISPDIIKKRRVPRVPLQILEFNNAKQSRCGFSSSCCLLSGLWAEIFAESLNILLYRRLPSESWVTVVTPLMPWTWQRTMLQRATSLAGRRFPTPQILARMKYILMIPLTLLSLGVVYVFHRLRRPPWDKIR
jgi:hypothetical protein